MNIRTVTIVGLGLIGGSLGLALRRRAGLERVVGYDVDLKMTDAALALGAVDKGALSLQEATAGADVVFLCTPLSAIVPVAREIASMLSPGAILSDVGSTKAQITTAVTKLMPPDVCFVGGHPMAGSERGGIMSADPYLFENAVYVLTPPTGNEQVVQDAVRRLTDLIQCTGAEVVTMDPKRHDQIVAAVSHLPHAVAACLANAVAPAADKDPALLALAAGGFRDTTRVASGDPKLWVDIFRYNREPVLAQAQLMAAALQAFIAALEADSPSRLENFLQRAKKLRDQVTVSSKGIVKPVTELVVQVADKPGAIAEVAQTLAEHDINIVDIEILRVREGEGGALRIAVSDLPAAQRAVDLLQKRDMMAQVRQ